MFFRPFSGFLILAFLVQGTVTNAVLHTLPWYNSNSFLPLSTLPADVNPQLIQIFVVGHPALLADIV